MANIKLTNFPSIANQDWISDNILNNRGGRFVAPVAKDVVPLMPVRRGNLANKNFSVALKTTRHFTFAKASLLLTVNTMV